MKSLFFIMMCLSLVSTVSFADECKVTDLKVEAVQQVPKPELKKSFFKQTQEWFGQETHLQEPSRANYDTIITASGPRGHLVQILIEGHTREFGVETKWSDARTLAVSVEWGHAMFCKYQIDLEKAKAAVLK